MITRYISTVFVHYVFKQRLFRIKFLYVFIFAAVNKWIINKNYTDVIVIGFFFM